MISLVVVLITLSFPWCHFSHHVGIVVFLINYFLLPLILDLVWSLLGSYKFSLRHCLRSFYKATSLEFLLWVKLVGINVQFWFLTCLVAFRGGMQSRNSKVISWLLKLLMRPLLGTFLLLSSIRISEIDAIGRGLLLMLLVVVAMIFLSEVVSAVLLVWVLVTKPLLVSWVILLRLLGRKVHYLLNENLFVLNEISFGTLNLIKHGLVSLTL